MNRIVAGLHFTVDAAAGEVLGLTLGQYFVTCCGAAPTYNAWRFDGTQFPDPTLALAPPNDGDFYWDPTSLILLSCRQSKRQRRHQRRHTRPCRRSALNRPSPLLDGYGVKRWESGHDRNDKRLFERRRPSKPEDFASVPGVDPFVDWALGPGRKYFFLPGRSAEWVPVRRKVERYKGERFCDGDTVPDEKFNIPNKSIVSAKSVQISMLETQGPGAAELNSYCAPTVAETFFHLLKQQASLRELVARRDLGSAAGH